MHTIIIRWVALAGLLTLSALSLAADRELQPSDLEPRDFQGYVETRANDGTTFNLYMDIRGQLSHWNEGHDDGATRIGYTPTVVFEAGYNGSAHQWAFAQTALSEHTLTVSYSRAGQGSSQPSPDPRTFVNQMRELYTALQNAEVPGPYLFVGHSSGGLKARVFADEYPQQVAGMVFVDASHENQGQLLMNYLTDEALAMLPAPHFVGDESLQTLLAESAYVRTQVDDARLGELPLTVLSSNNLGYLDIRDGAQALAEQQWVSLQQELATLSDYSRMKVDWSGRAGHYLHLEKPHWTTSAIINTLYHPRALAQAKGVLVQP